MLKNKKIQLLTIIVIALSFVFFQSKLANKHKLQAKESETSSVTDSQNKMLGFPYLSDIPSDRGDMLTGYDKNKTIILGKTEIASLEGKYSFIPRWTEKIIGKNSGTEVLNSGFTEITNPGQGYTGKVYQYTPEDFDSKKPANMTYTNVGLFKGKWIDMRITVSNVEKNGGFNTKGDYRGLLIGGTNKHFNQIRLTRAVSTRENEYPSVELTYEYLEHGTENKVEVTGYNVFADLDHRESILLDENKMNLQKLIVPGDTLLSFKKTDGLLHLMPYKPGDNAPDDEASREEAKKSWAAYTFGPTSSYPLIFRMSDSTTRADNEGLLPFKTDNPNKIGYDNDNLENENNVEFSVYQYTPNNGEKYRYNSFTWLDPIHNAVKIESADDIKLKLGQTQQELPQKYYKVTIDRDVNIPAVVADPEIGVEAEPAGVRDVIRVEFTEAFMTDKDANGKLLMYGEMLQMDIKGTLNKANRPAVQATYDKDEKVFIIPNRSELRYTDNIAVSDDPKKNISSNTAFSKIKSGETVQTFVSKKVINKTAEEDSNRQPTDKAKVGDILNYEMEVKNLSLVPTNIWKSVDISDTIVKFLTVDANTISVTKNGTQVTHVYEKNTQKLSLPKQDILPDDIANLKINFSAEINFSASGESIDNWIYADGFDPLNLTALEDKANALLPQKVENLVPPTIILNEKTGVSTGDAKTLTGTFKDPDSDNVSIYYQVDSEAPVKIITDRLNSPKNTDIPYEFTIPKSELPEGPHSIKVYAIDSEALESEPERLQLTDGILKLLSAPEIIVFGTNIAVKASDQRINEPESMDKDLIISDQRGMKKDWVLKAKLTEELHNVNDSSIVLEKAIRYVYKNKEVSLNSGAQKIYQPDDNTASLYNVNSTWTEQGDGLKLETKAGEVQQSGSYEAKILWQLVDGPTSSGK